MQPGPSRWECAPYEVALAERLASGLGLSRPVASILARRGFADVEEARRFIAGEERHDPLDLPGAQAACELILDHVRRGSRVAVFGDYDVDGVCSAAMMVRTLRALGADPVWELPSRFDEGYGLSGGAVERLAARGVGAARDGGLRDHGPRARSPPLALPAWTSSSPTITGLAPRFPDCVVVHPALGAYGCPELCASGVVLKLSEALHAAAGRDPARRRGRPRPRGARHSLRSRAAAGREPPDRARGPRGPGQNQEAGAQGSDGGGRAWTRASSPSTRSASGWVRVSTRPGAWGGRTPRLELLLTDDPGRAQEVARELDLLNRDRQEAETRILFAAEAACLPQASAGAIVVAGEGWHPGVVGIVASRLVERWRRPCVVIALEDGMGRGSGRSISAYDLHAGLGACAEHLSRFGGHRMAAGVELPEAAVEPFRRALAAHAAAALSPTDLIPCERVDAVVPGGVLGPRACRGARAPAARSGWATPSPPCSCRRRASSM